MIISNKVRCLVCGEVIESTSVHSFKRCKCGNVAVDGGHDYLKRSYKTNNYEELSETTNEEGGEDEY